MAISVHHQLMKLILPLLISSMALFLLMIPSTQAAHFMYCDGRGYYVITINDLLIFPDALESSKPAFFFISANANQTISNGTFVVDIWFLNIFLVHRETHDLCTKTSDGCPISTGFFVLTHLQVLPFLMPGVYFFHIRMFDENGYQLTCIMHNCMVWASVADS